MKLKHYIVNIFIICFSLHLQGQVSDTIIPSNTDTIPRIKDDNDQKLTVIDTTRTSDFFNPADTMSRGNETDSPGRKVSSDPDVKISKDGLDDEIEYGSVDSSYTDLKNNQIHLFGEAYVKYKDYNLKAGYIIFDFEKNEASAFRYTDSLGNLAQRPDFTDGSNEFKSNGLRFNFKTSKGLIFDAVTKEGEFTIHGERTKFVSKDSDSTAVDDQIFNKDAIITTCDADHPHYGIRAWKLKVVPNKLAIIGVSQLEIMGIPTPIILPFGFFPLVEGRSSGLIFPNNIEFDPNLGVGFREVGYYFPINDYFDLRVTGDIYTRGTHRISLRSNYKKRYKYTGNVQLSYSNNIGENAVDLTRQYNRAYSLRVTHNQDSKAHPYRQIGGTINLSTNRYDQINTNSYENVVNNKINSNFFYKHSLPGTPFSISSAFTHFQDNLTRKVDITLPDTKLRMNTIYPFKSNKGGQEKWYEKINVGYDAKFKNLITATDTTLFTSEVWENMQTGLSHTATSGASFNVLKYINVTANAKFDQFVTSRQLERTLYAGGEPDTIGVTQDQTGMDVYEIEFSDNQLRDSLVNSLSTVETFNVGITAQTQLFATRRFSKGWLRGLRHTAKPSLGFTYNPDFQERYFREVGVDSLLNPDEIEDIDVYNPYRNGVFNPSLRSKQMNLTYKLTNFFEGKYWSKADSTEKKFKILNNLNIDGFYNFAADSLKWSPLNIRGNAQFFKGITQVNFNARYNFYETNENGQLVNTLIWSKNKRPVEFDNFNFIVTNSSTLGKLRELIFGKTEEKINLDKSSQEKGKRQTKVLKKGVKFTDWIDQFRISHQFSYAIMKQNNGIDTSFVRSHSIKLSGRIDLTDSWNLSINNISYDLVRKTFVFPQFSLNRDIHCWTMQFSWTPALEVYSFFIGVKSNSLSFLKYNYGQRNSSRLF